MKATQERIENLIKANCAKSTLHNADSILRCVNELTKGLDQKETERNYNLLNNIIQATEINVTELEHLRHMENSRDEVKRVKAVADITKEVFEDLNNDLSVNVDVETLSVAMPGIVSYSYKAGINVVAQVFKNTFQRYVIENVELDNNTNNQITDLSDLTGFGSTRLEKIATEMTLTNDINLVVKQLNDLLIASKEVWDREIAKEHKERISRDKRTKRELTKIISVVDALMDSGLTD